MLRHPEEILSPPNSTSHATREVFRYEQVLCVDRAGEVSGAHIHYVRFVLFVFVRNSVDAVESTLPLEATLLSPTRFHAILVLSGLGWGYYHRPSLWKGMMRHTLVFPGMDSYTSKTCRER